MQASGKREAICRWLCPVHRGCLGSMHETALKEGVGDVCRRGWRAARVPWPPTRRCCGIRCRIFWQARFPTLLILWAGSIICACFGDPAGVKGGSEAISGLHGVDGPDGTFRHVPRTVRGFIERGAWKSYDGFPARHLLQPARWRTIKHVHGCRPAGIPRGISSGSRTSSCLNDLFVVCNRSEVTHKSSELVPKKYGTAFASTRGPAEQPRLVKFGVQNAHNPPRRRRIRRAAIRPFRREQIRACRRGALRRFRRRGWPPPGPRSASAS